MAEAEKMEKIIALAKRRGFIYPGSELYGGLSGFWDYGPNGVALKERVRRLWWQMFVERRADIYGLDAAIIMNPAVWEASGHVKGFTDPLVECATCKHRFRADHLDDAKVCPDCGGALGGAKRFNMMFETRVGASDGAAETFLRPETAQGIFANFKNVLDTFHPRLPFGIAQIGKAFRNEIAPRDFLFRAREFEQMEIEWFVREKQWEKDFEMWREEMWAWIDAIGLSRERVHEAEVPADELAHYSKRTIDFEFDYPFGRSELYGLAYRTDHDLKAHSEASGTDLTYFDQEANERFLPHVIEPSLGIERTVLALLVDAYTEEEAPTADGKSELRAVLKFAPAVAPVSVSVLPLMRKPELIAGAKEIFDTLVTKGFAVHYDETGSIGKRYRRQDEIGTPYCVTFDFDSLEDKQVTVRDRDSMEQERVAIAELPAYLKEKLAV